MKTYILTIIIVVVLISVVLVGYRKKDQVSGLGKTGTKVRPPKLRIVYSKKLKPADRQKISSSADAYRLLKDIWSKQIETREEMLVLLLDRSNNVLGYHLLSVGGITGTVADLRLLFSVALESLATSVILSHNHPSGNLSPSEQDTTLTRKIKEAGVIMDITLLDHLIITNEGYYSFADEGVI
ncbi:MAG TPA: DNA repair protein [Bacteroidales bacterium]|nr:MAG: repair protein RadC protein [candidate division TM6 bacterium GW2011_GWF2_33_332]HBS89138.1 DNA repair protein [Bacteroidales bacterium]